VEGVRDPPSADIPAGTDSRSHAAARRERAYGREVTADLEVVLMTTLENRSTRPGQCRDTSVAGALS
jgi:hypothetical protein